MQLHGIAGLPRAGSTMLCNVLNQNPAAVASSTSALPGFVRALSGVASNRIEVKNLLDKQPAETVARINEATRAFCFAWYGAHAGKLVFDKSRGWAAMPEAFRDVNPGGVIFVLVRDLRAVFASVEKQNRKSGMLQDKPDSIYDRYRETFSPGGVIGSPLQAIRSLIATRPKNCFYIRYEDFVRDPGKTLGNVYGKIGADGFAHNFQAVENTAIDPDGFYLHKYPHQGCGAVEVRPETWPEIVPQDICADIMQTAKDYNEFFAYTPPKKHKGAA